MKKADQIKQTDFSIFLKNRLFEKQIFWKYILFWSAWTRIFRSWRNNKFTVNFFHTSRKCFNTNVTKMQTLPTSAKNKEIKPKHLNWGKIKRESTGKPQVGAETDNLNSLRLILLSCAKQVQKTMSQTTIFAV